MKSFKTFCLFSIALTVVIAGPAPAMLFDVATDFSTTDNGDANPWSYRDNTDQSLLANYQFCEPCAGDIGDTHLVWQTNVIPLIGKVDAAGWGFPGSSPQAPSDSSDGDMMSHGPSLLRLTIPNTVGPGSQATITGDFWRPRSSAVSDVRFSVVHSGAGGTIVNDVSLDGTNSGSSHSFSQDVTVNPGETIDVQMVRNNFYAFQFSVEVVPEPSSLLLCGMGLTGLILTWHRGRCR